MELFWELYDGLPQEGPGNDECTFKALSLIPGLPDHPAILDVGCGPGRQTMVLASNTRGHVIAVDNHQAFLDEVDRRAAAAGIADRVTSKNRSMIAMEIDEGSQDLIWAEGAIYIMGFREGLTEWKPLLQPNGVIAVSEVSWLTDNRPEEAIEFWKDGYPEMVSVDANKQTIEDAGYDLIDTFTLPEDAWWHGYYDNLQKRIDQLRTKYEGDADIKDFLDENEAEIGMYRKYSATYGYVFYIMRQR